MSFTALVIGSMLPDLPYFLPFRIGHGVSHTAAGLLLFCLPAGMVCIAFYKWFFADFLRTLIPDLPEVSCRTCRPLRLSGLLLIGAATHLMWDSFTHHNTVVVSHIPLLQYEVARIGGYTLAMCNVLQHTSSIIGLSILSAVSFTHWKKRPVARLTPVATPLARYLVMAALFIIPSIHASIICYTHQPWKALSWFALIHHNLGVFAFTFGQASLLVLILGGCSHAIGKLVILERRHLHDSIQICIIFVCVSAFSCLWGVDVMGTYLTAPARQVIGHPPAMSNWKTVAILPTHKSTIRGWFGRGIPGKGAILLLHGNRGNRLQMVGRARFLQQSGYSVLLIDMQAHGESEGSRITFGKRESESVETAIDYLRQVLPNEPIGIIGTSLGGAAALLSTGARPFHGIILEAVYPTLDDAVENRLTHYLGIYGSFLSPLLTRQLPAHVSISASELRPVDSLSRIDCPVMIIGGVDDQRTTVENTHRLFEAAPAARQLWLIHGAGHIDFHRFKKREYENRVTRFFDMCFKTR